jgi:16S rRNA (uracil1498-N3)-methyltransferase
VNLLLFEPEEILHPLPPGDPRIRHVREVLRRRPGQSFDCGLIDGPRGRATVGEIDDTGLRLEFHWGDPPPPADPITLVVGLARPQTVRKILGEATALGVARIVFFPADKSERSYGDSRLWSSGEVRRLLIAGAEQAFCTRLPVVDRVNGLTEAMTIASPETIRLALDLYEATVPLSHVALPSLPPSAMLAVGAERGWSTAEREVLRAVGCTLVHLGGRVLRTETACVAGLTLLKARAGWL